METLIKPRGKLIIIEGADGSGKTVQSELLMQYLKNKNTSARYFNFPRYDTFYGQTVARFLRGEFGDINQVSPYLASLPYSLDRLSAKTEIADILNRGEIVIANRYATSNLAHQGAKFAETNERDKYLNWLETMEYKINQIPKEDC